MKSPRDKEPSLRLALSHTGMCVPISRSTNWQNDLTHVLRRPVEVAGESDRLGPDLRDQTHKKSSHWPLVEYYYFGTARSLWVGSDTREDHDGAARMGLWQKVAGGAFRRSGLSRKETSEHQADLPRLTNAWCTQRFGSSSR